ncbi:MAG: type II toxin-antitoxin system ParD family antitoxin [Proteobacteria bacterium]|nr:type II toxin-antitoxin system ParD family antitoxin [Pseudomonadota bacterium]
MGMVKKSITVTHQQDEWIKSQIASGEYGNDSELLRDLIRRRQHADAELAALRAAVQEGLDSGMSDRTPEDVRQDVLQRLRVRDRLPAQ